MPRKAAPRPGRVAADDVARHLIWWLQQDGRKSYAAIGTAVGLSGARSASGCSG